MSNNPFSVPDSPPALIDAPKSRTKGVLHWIAFGLILIVWYGASTVSFGSWLVPFYTPHVITILLLSRNHSPVDYVVLVAAIEISFFALFCFTSWRRSIQFTLGVLAFVFFWSVMNVTCFLMFCNE